MELAGLELRTAIAVALEWRWVRLNRHDPYCYFMPPEAAMRYRDAEESDTRRPMSLPPWESDPAAFWPEFEKWRAGQNYVRVEFLSEWHKGKPNHQHFCTIVIETTKSYIWRSDASGETRELAGCRCWLDAMQQRKAERP